MSQKMLRHIPYKRLPSRYEYEFVEVLSGTPVENQSLYQAAPALLENLKAALAYIEANAANKECKAMDGKEWAEAKREAQSIAGLSVGRWAGDEVTVNLSAIRDIIESAESQGVEP